MIIASLKHNITWCPLTRALFCVNGEYYFYSKAVWRSVIPTPQHPEYSRRFPPSAITRDVFHQRADEVRIIMNSFTLKVSALPFIIYFFILFIMSYLHMDRKIQKALCWTNQRWIFHSRPVALPAGQHIKAASCLGFALQHYNCYWLPRPLFHGRRKILGRIPPFYLFIFFFTGVGIDLSPLLQGSVFT